MTLGDRVVLDGSTVENLNAPALTRWATIAFVHNRPGLVAAALAEEDALEVARKEQRAMAAAELHRTRIMHKIIAMKRVMGSFLEHDDEEVAMRDHCAEKKLEGWIRFGCCDTSSSAAICAIVILYLFACKKGKVNMNSSKRSAHERIRCFLIITTF